MRYPNSLSAGLAKIGGLKAFLGIGLVTMSMIHEWLFNRKLRRDLSGKLPSTAKDNTLEERVTNTGNDLQSQGESLI